MTFQLRDTTIEMQKKIFDIYRISPKMAMLEVGTGGGKTYASIHIAAKIDPNIHLIIFTTNSIAKTPQWPNSIKDYNEVMSSKLTHDIYNYEILTATKKFPELLKHLNKIQKSGKQIFLILDEIHLIKLSSSAKASKRANEIITISRLPVTLTTLGLSATTISNSFLDVATYLIIAGFYRNSREFIRQHVKRYDDYHSPIVKDKSGQIREEYFKDPDQIKALYKMITVKVDTSKYLPKVHLEDYTFQLSKNYRKKYNQILSDYKLGVYEYPIQARSAQQNMLVNNLSPQKDLALISVIERRKRGDFDKKTTPILIFYEYTVSLLHLERLLTELYPNYKLYYINGIRKKPKQMTKPPEDDAIYLIQYLSGGEGLDWQWSNCSIFYEGATRQDKFKQALGRNVRDKTVMSDVYHFYFKYKNTIDFTRWQVIQYKTEFTTKLSNELFYKELANYKDD